MLRADITIDNLKEIIDTQHHKNLVSRPVSKTVNSIQNNSADLIKQVWLLRRGGPCRGYALWKNGTPAYPSVPKTDFIDIFRKRV
jgi:hypothetical protein